jgi:hypothetical protein
LTFATVRHRTKVTKEPAPPTAAGTVTSFPPGDNLEPVAARGVGTFIQQVPSG